MEQCMCTKRTRGVYSDVKHDNLIHLFQNSTGHVKNSHVSGSIQYKLLKPL